MASESRPTRLCTRSVRDRPVLASSETTMNHTPIDHWTKNHQRVLVIGGVTVATTAIAPILPPVILNGVGFTAGGVAAGSWAAGVQASIGNVAAGSLFAAAQSIGAGAAVPLSVWFGSAGLGLSAGMAVGMVRRPMAWLGESSALQRMKNMTNGLQGHQTALTGMMAALWRKGILGQGPGSSLSRWFASLPRPGGRVRSD
jgi:hypothetical protein